MRTNHNFGGSLLVTTNNDLSSLAFRYDLAPQCLITCPLLRILISCHCYFRIIVVSTTIDRMQKWPPANYYFFVLCVNWPN